MNPPKFPTALLGVAGATVLALLLLSRPVPASPAPVQPGHSAPSTAAGPLGAIHAHVCGFHFYSGDPARALRVDHYCSHHNGDVFQCVIYDSDQANARLIGVEYIISEARFTQLPADEKKLWHSHRYEVMSGLLTAPGLPAAAEKELMAELVNTYGKTWHLWQVDRGDQVPLGLPKLMMGFTADGQADPAMVARRGQGLDRDPDQVRAQRADLPVRPIAPGADAWQHEPAFQLNDALLK